MILYLNCNKYDSQVTFNKKDYLLRAAKRLGFDWVRDYQKRNIDDPVEYVLNIEPFKDFVKGSKHTSIWEIDLIADRAELEMSNWVCADEVFLANSLFPPKAIPFREGTNILFQACDPEIHKPIPMEEKYDFVFAGSMGGPMYAERERVYNLMQSKFTFKDYGKNHPPEEYVQCLNHARVQFIRSGSTHVAFSYLAQRFFECLAIGPVLTDYHTDLELTGLIENVDYLAYRNDAEMIQKMHYLIDYPEEAALIAHRGRQKALMLHTYEHRLMSIINKIKYGQKNI